VSHLIKIAHRGNISEPNPSKENHPDYLTAALNLGYDVEVDVWLIDGKFILGHDGPQYEVSFNFLYNEHFWLHAKNIPAISDLNVRSRSYLINCFFHDADDCVLTSQGWIWTYPGKTIIGPGAIAVMPERVPDWDISKASGICSDYLNKY
jgi:hypothetical protein